ncbi:hypothetical protein SAMN02745181_0906 [Rubritalea squalenifaciens DSM 18772]|uniref:Uncharacterized protein n=1 Tax=Rubritalea squalenifaciens DSM 18772 TaxID=1123071 RepID=A0A1M6E218_9BACT|nr:hypothetical protein [Rubritalea squalenifaciens]SHI79445.1 hypothetical protein SAMN02745181_0906 [Rubritalea squalenifaciens DSM 18772]
MSGKPEWIYKSGGKFFYANGDNLTTEVQSQFAQNAEAVAQQSIQKNSWKQSSDNTPFGMSATAWKANNSWEHYTPKFESISRAKAVGEVYYVLSLPNVSGLFKKDLNSDEEHRIFHKDQIDIAEIRHHPKSKYIAASLRNKDNAHIVVMSNHKFDYKILTDGDVFDSSPSWDQEHGTSILYQSSGIGRDEDGYYAGRTPSSIEQICVKTGEHQTLLEDAEHDLLAPQTDAEGNLYFIRRPMENSNRKLPLHKVALETILIPFRIAKTAYLVVDSISKLTRKKPLANLGPEDKPQQPQKWKNIKGVMVDLSKTKSPKGEDEASIVPHSWKLIKRLKDGSEQVLKTALLDFDVRHDGAILASDGRKILSIIGGKTQTLLKTDGIADEVRWM